MSQSSRIRGEVRDSITGELLGFINIYSPDSKKATVTDESGIFYFNIPSQGLTLKASSLGYSSVEKRFTPKDTLLSILLSPEATYLEEVTVRKKKKKYSKRNNPAVEFMERIRAAKDKTDPRNEELYSYRLYEKIVMGLNDFNPKRLDGKKNGKFGFLKNCIDTALWTGKTILDLTIKEKVATHIYSSDPKRSKEIVEGVRSVGIDDILDKANVQTAVGDVMREVDIYSPSITLLQNRFVSPLSPLGPDVYRYYLTDTVTIGDERYIELSFSPRNPETMGFNGKLYVAEGDSSMFIKRVTMRVPSAINLNYVNSLSISQNFVKDSLGNRHKILDDMTAELQLIPGTPEFYARRLAIYDSFSYTPGDSVASRLDRLGNQFVIDEAENRNDLFWTSNRMIPLSAAEASMNGLMTGFRKFPLIYWGEKIVGIIARGYIRTGDPSRFDFGPVNSFISFNDVEGIRLKVGGLTTANLSPHLFARGYVAYGFKDGKPKYRIEGEYSFSRKKYHSREFPVHALRALHQYDLDRLGQHYLFTSPDNIFLSLKRKGDDLVTYRRLSEFNYILELRNNFSLQATLRHEVQNKSHWIEFENGFGQHFSKFTQSAICVALRWAPGETFTQGYTNRAPVNMDAPIFQLTHEYGPKGFLGADFLLNRSEISIQKRIWLSAFGYFDAIVKGGIIWSQVYYPALLWPNVNLSYTIQPESYALMDAMEFANDRYASLDVTYWSQGLLFNHLPWVSKLKLRETISFKALWGGLSHKNNPEYNPSLLKFPSDAGCRVMSGRPYMELGIGLDNILTILRVEYIWRLSYRDLPGTDKSGLRIALHFSF
ncbi:MAG: carboxypeptidase-like regulatory domain-containing protein [Bacteroidales bacterium]|nr:carboxypeptidase-like regulatory domain-containing protein [Bacteroidales bacterium]